MSRRAVFTPSVASETCSFPEDIIRSQESGTGSLDVGGSWLALTSVDRCTVQCPSPSFSTLDLC